MDRFNSILEDWPANEEVPTSEGLFPFLCFQLWGRSEKGHTRAQGDEYLFPCENVYFHPEEKVLQVEVERKSVPAYEIERRILNFRFDDIAWMEVRNYKNLPRKR